MQEKVKFSEKLGFLFFSAATNIVYNFKSMYYLTFLTMILQIDVGVAGAMVAIGTIWDAVNDPIIAVFCANHKFKSGEKVRPYALYCCLPWAITVVLLFTNFHVSTGVNVVLGLLIYFVFEGLYTFLDMPYNTLASLATKSDEERKSINSFRSLGGCLGTAIGAVAILPIVKLFGGLQDHSIVNSTDADALFKTAITMGVICTVGSLIHYFTSKERIREEEEKEEHISLLQAYKMLFRCKSWVRNMVFILCYGIANVLVMQNINYYASYILGNSSAATPVMAAYLVVAVLTASFTPKIDQKLGRQNALIFAAGVCLLGKVPFILNPYSMINIYINALTVGFGMTMIFILFNTNRNNIADILEVQNGRRIDTLVAGGDNLIAKLSQALAVEIMTLAYSAAGYNEALGIAQTAATKTVINSLLGIVPAALMVILIFIAKTLDTRKELEESLAKKNQR